MDGLALKAAHIGQGTGDGHIHPAAGGVANGIAQHRHGIAGGVGIQGNEGGKALEPDVHGIGFVEHIHPDVRGFPPHAAAPEPGQAGGGDIIEAMGEGEGGLQLRLDHPGDRFQARGLGPDAKEGEGKIKALARGVEELKIPQFAPGAYGDIAGADAPQQEGGLGSLGAIGFGFVGFKQFLVHSGCLLLIVGPVRRCGGGRAGRGAGYGAEEPGAPAIAGEALKLWIR